MVTIIKRPISKVYEITCEECGCVFQFGDEDLLNNQLHEPYIIFCPDCKHLYYKPNATAKFTYKDDVDFYDKLP